MDKYIPMRSIPIAILPRGLQYSMKDHTQTSICSCVQTKSSGPSIPKRGVFGGT
ncbi:hypothetical protein [Paenibacillus medicaginis]|uniref:Uncharacterized protein n=1 Tax=Paenibacillus medicaginis TaxID=1470560 RepID=A0ABV5C780_9BACL